MNAALSLLARAAARCAAALGLQRHDGHWVLPAVGSYFEEPPGPAAGPAR